MRGMAGTPRARPRSTVPAPPSTRTAQLSGMYSRASRASTSTPTGATRATASPANRWVCRGGPCRALSADRIPWLREGTIAYRPGCLARKQPTLSATLQRLFIPLAFRPCGGRRNRSARTMREPSPTRRVGWPSTGRWLKNDRRG